MTHREPVPFAHPSPGFESGLITISPGDSMGCDGLWQDALIVIEQGSIELVTADGDACTFVRGDMLCRELAPRGGLRNAGASPAVLRLVKRRS
jgi:hypothetical protein